MNEQVKGIGRIQNSHSVKKGKNYLLAIGINDYSHCPKLYNAVNDIEKFADLLQKKYSFDVAHTHILRNKEATSDNILTALKTLIQTVQVNDSVLIYFSGHGELDNVLDEGFWIPVEAEIGKTNQYIANSTIQKVLLKLNSRHTFLIIDSCYSGSLFLEGRSKFVSDAYDFPSRWGLTSGRNAIVSDGKAGTHSPFALALIRALQGTDKPMNVSALCDIVKQAVPADTNNRQKPIGEPLSIPGHEGGQFLFEPTETKTEVEKRAFDQAKNKKSVAALTKFLKDYPSSNNLEEVTKLLQEAEEDAAWKEATVMAGQTLQGLDGKLQPDKEWRMEVTDEFANRLYVLHINAEKPR